MSVDHRCKAGNICRREISEAVFPVVPWPTSRIWLHRYDLSPTQIMMLYHQEARKLVGLHIDPIRASDNGMPMSDEGHMRRAGAPRDHVRRERRMHIASNICAILYRYCTLHNLHACIGVIGSTTPAQQSKCDYVRHLGDDLQCLLNGPGLSAPCWVRPLFAWRDRNLCSIRETIARCLRFELVLHLELGVLRAGTRAGQNPSRPV
jgi:hypothetical protein